MVTTMSTLHRDYWANTGDPNKKPRASFQAVWVQQYELIKLATRERSLRAQYIRPTDIF